MFDPDEEYGPKATMSDAHREWHRNARVPMGTPGCPQDACHPIEVPLEEDDGCPWCGASERDILLDAGTQNFDAALEAHVQECEQARKELGGLI
jgi:hypothetical protein